MDKICLICGKRIICRNAKKYCSKNCYCLGLIKQVIVSCSCCGKSISVEPNRLKKSKSGKLFCTQSCSAIYSNTHKTTGNRRSKLEIWIESKIKHDFPNLETIYNGKDAIKSEIDVYFPKLKLAIELNGIYHYEPIYGKEKLISIQNNDNRKTQACLEQGIELIIIDTTSLIYFKEEKAMVFYKIISNIINEKLGDLNRF